MKNRFRGIAVVLAAALMATFWVPVTFAAGGGLRATTETALLSVVGVYDEDAAVNAVSEREVTRAEAVYYTLLLSGVDKDEFAGLYEPIFEDVPQTHKYAGAITMAHSMHIISDGFTFQPDAKVTVNEMTKMLVAVLGYNAYAQLNGGYPAGYVTIANKEGLFGGVTASGDEALTFRNMTMMLNNTLHATYMEQVSAGGKIDFRTQKGVTLLSRVFHIYDGVGQITQNDITAINSKEGLGEGKIEVGGHICDITDTALQAKLMQYLGYEGTYYIKEENGDKTLVFFLPDRSEVTTIFSEDFDSYESGTLRYYASNGKLKTLQISPDAALLYNGKAVTESFDNSLFKSDWGEIQIIKNSGVSDVVSIRAYENYVVSAIDQENYVVYDNTVAGRKLDFREDAELSKYAYFRSKTGETLSFDKLTEGAVLSAAVSLERDFFDVIVVNETVSGKLDRMQTENVNGTTRVKSVVVDANEYKLADNMYYGDRWAQLQPGTRYTFGLDAGGRIANFTASRNVTGGYVFLIDAKQIESGLSHDVQFRVLDGNGKVVILNAAKNIEIDGARYKHETESDKIIAALSVDGTVQGAIYSQVAEIVVNDNGEITEIDTARLTEAEDKRDSLQSICDITTPLRYKATPKTFDSYFGINGSTKVFFYPADSTTSKTKGGDKEYSVGGMSYFKNDSTYTLQAFARDKESPLAMVLTLEGSANQTISAQEYIMVVSEVCTALTDEGETKTMLRGFYQGAEVQLYIDDDDVLLVDAETGKTAASDSSRTVSVDKGDCIRFGQDTEGYVSEIELFYDYSEQRSYADNSNMDQHILFQVMYAPLYQMKDGFITLCKNLDERPDAETNPKRHFVSGGYKVYVVENAGRNGVNVRLGSTKDLKDYYTYHDDCSMLLLQLRYYDPRTMVIYQK